ncbi:MAG: PHP domain-containing protein [Anaerolineales bacterium]|nr:PHP domain-containing protein [Anaerolineales bacterium]
MKPSLLRIDFHTHTNFSKDSLTRPERLVKASLRKQIDRLVVADHNTIAGALQAQALDPERIILGEEIMTTGGEILAAYVTTEVPPCLSPTETIERLREQGAFISVSHPFDTLRKGHWALKDLLEIAPLVDAIEVFNARCMRPGSNRKAAQYALEHDLPGTAGSDAHAVFELGTALMLLPQFEGPDELRAVIRQSKIQARLSPWWVHFASRYASYHKGLGRRLDNVVRLP